MEITLYHTVQAYPLSLEDVLNDVPMVFIPRSPDHSTLPCEQKEEEECIELPF